MTEVENKMGRIFATVPEDLENKFRLECIEAFGPKQGNLSQGIVEAIILWLIMREKKPINIKKALDIYSKKGKEEPAEISEA